MLLRSSKTNTVRISFQNQQHFSLYTPTIQRSFIRSNMLKWRWMRDHIRKWGKEDKERPKWSQHLYLLTQAVPSAVPLGQKPSLRMILFTTLSHHIRHLSPIWSWTRVFSLALTKIISTAGRLSCWRVTKSRNIRWSKYCIQIDLEMCFLASGRWTVSNLLQTSVESQAVPGKVAWFKSIFKS